MKRAARAMMAAFTVGCATSGPLPASPPGVVAETMTVTSRSFSSGGAIPVDNTCDGRNAPPDVTWSSPPEATKSLVVILDDVEAPNGAGTRWLVLDLPPETRTLRANVDPTTLGAKLGLNDGREASYRGPCPPHHEGHHFALRVIALDRMLNLPDGSDRERVNGAMNGHVLGSGELVGTSFR